MKKEPKKTKKGMIQPEFNYPLYLFLIESIDDGIVEIRRVRTQGFLELVTSYAGIWASLLKQPFTQNTRLKVMIVFENIESMQISQQSYHDFFSGFRVKIENVIKDEYNLNDLLIEVNEAVKKMHKDVNVLDILIYDVNKHKRANLDLALYTKYLPELQ